MRVLAIGTIMADVMAVGLPSVAEPGEVMYTDVATHIGGHPIDVAIDLVKLGTPPESVAVVAAVGYGPYGSFVRQVIDGYGIPTFLQDIADDDTGCNLVLEVAGEDRRFHLDPGANWQLGLDHVKGAVAAWKPDLVTLRPGYCGIDLGLVDLLSPLEGVVVLLDIMQPHPARPPGFLFEVLPFVDIVHCNEREALINTGAHTLELAVERFLSAGVGLVLVTSGHLGARAFTSRWEVAQQGFVVETVDATGCGDAFCAGVILYLENHLPTPIGELDSGQLTELLLSAQAIGASAATAIGCVEGVSVETAEAIVRDQGDAIRLATQIKKTQGGDHEPE